jgi:hypothetical protein
MAVTFLLGTHMVVTFLLGFHSHCVLLLRGRPARFDVAVVLPIHVSSHTLSCI